MWSIMRRGRFGLILLIAVVLMVMVGAIFWLGSNVLTSGSQHKATEQGKNNRVLREPKDDTRVTLSVRGPVVAKENSYTISIDISGASRKLYVNKAYGGAELVKIELDNNRDSFKNFLLAFSDNGYASTIKSDVKQNNGLCSTGQLINFGLFETKDKQVLNSWTTSCGNTAGDFGGNRSRVIALILDQFPDGKQQIDKALDKINKQEDGVLSLTF